MEEDKGPILHVIVVGFHHKKGCQVEYSFPPLVPGSPNECPVGWKYLPTLALPDGSHNYDEDTAYFHLPSLTNPRKTVYGISCFRQIPVEKLKNRTDDITRGTVQKSVCVLSHLPLYGHIEVKMALITHAYFEEGDFSKVSLLQDTYHHLNSVLLQNNSPTQHFVGLSARDFILQWRHKAVLLYKLLLLERRLIFFKSPVQPLCTTILTLLSLHPGMIEKGLEQSACIKLSRPMSPMPDFDEENYEATSNSQSENTNNQNNINNAQNDNIVTENHIQNPTNNDNHSLNPENRSQSLENGSNELCNIENNGSTSNLSDKSHKSSDEKSDTEKIEIVDDSQLCDIGEREKNSLPRDTSIDNIENNQNVNNLTHIDIESCGIPLCLFTQGYLCLPYLSLPYIDLLSDVNIRGYIVGATNVLFKQKRRLADVLIEVDGTRIESQDPELRKQLHLTTEDLRFADFIVRHVQEERHDVFLDGVGWEGGDEWIRAQFRVYLMCLLRTSMLQDGSREIEHFNSSFVAAWKDTHNYKMWVSGENSGILEVNPGHPFAGQLSVADMKLRLAHTMQNTEGGRKLNQAMVSTGRAVATTGRAVGGAISHAKGALSNWWSNLLVSPDNRPAICEGEDVLTTVDKLNSQSCQDIVKRGNLDDENFDNKNIKNNSNSDTNIPQTCDRQIINNGDIIENKKERNIDNNTDKNNSLETF